MTDAEAFQRQVLAELAALKADNIRLSAEIEHLRAAAHVVPSARPAGEQELSRRGLLKQAGGALAAGVGLAAAGSVLDAKPAAAQHTAGFGHDNATYERTTVRCLNSQDTLDVTNAFDGSAIHCYTSGVKPALRAQAVEAAGVHGNSVSFNGVVGSASYATNVHNGVYGVNLGRGNGVYGEQRQADSMGNGVLGISSGLGNSVFGYKAPDVPGDAVVGVAGSGRGVLASSLRGVTLEVAGTGRLRQALRPAGTPTVGSFFAGEQIRDAEGELWLCVADGSPGVWRRAATVREGFQGGSVNLLRRPVRVFDSRGGAPLRWRGTR